MVQCGEDDGPGALEWSRVVSSVVERVVLVVQCVLKIMVLVVLVVQCRRDDVPHGTVEWRQRSYWSIVVLVFHSVVESGPGGPVW